MIVEGDSVEVMRLMDADSVSAIITDPPYDLTSSKTAKRGFMGKSWDGTGVAFNVETWAEALRVLKPGGYLLAFGGTRTFHRMTVAIEDAGFEVRDVLSWNYGSGFPKSMDVGKAIDAHLGADRVVTGERRGDVEIQGGNFAARSETGVITLRDEPATPDGATWDGWGTALKPGWEPIVMARKPLSEKTVAANVLRWGTGAIYIDGARIPLNGETWSGNQDNARTDHGDEEFIFRGFGAQYAKPSNPKGRWPANVVMDEDAAALLDASVAPSRSRVQAEMKQTARETQVAKGAEPERYRTDVGYSDFGGPSRFYYCPKVSQAERNAGLDDLPTVMSGFSNGAQSAGEGYDAGQDIGLNRVIARKNHHPTVKPLALMRWLVRMVTPPGGVVFDPFTGSGSTGCAVALEPDLGAEFWGVDLMPEYVEIAQRRVAYWADTVARSDVDADAVLDAVGAAAE